MTSSFRIALTTIGSIEEAKRLSNEIIEKKLATCVNSIKIENSCYSWEDKVCNEAEFLLTIKTTDLFIPEIVSLLDIEHPYKTYFFTVLKPESINKSYFDWLISNIRK